MATAQQLIDRIRGELLAGTSERRNRLEGAYTAGSGTMVMEFDTTGIDHGSVLSVGTNTLFVWAVAAATKTATVTGGQDGSSDANASDGDVVRVNPRWTDHQIFAAMNEEIDSLSSPDAGLFAMRTKDLDFNNATGYDLASLTNFVDVYQVYNEISNANKEWVRVPQGQWRLDRDQDTGVFSSGLALRLTGALQTNVRVLYKSSFTRFTAVANNFTVTGLPTTAEQLLIVGTKIRLIMDREIKRNFTESQGEPRRASEVGSGSIARSWQALGILRDRLLQEERNRLKRAYPDLRW